jgi:hypothetical protein
LVHIAFRTLDSDGKTGQRAWSDKILAGDAASLLSSAFKTLLDEKSQFGPTPQELRHILDVGVTLVDSTLQDQLDASSEMYRFHFPHSHIFFWYGKNVVCEKRHRNVF